MEENDDDDDDLHRYSVTLSPLVINEEEVAQL